MFGPTGLVATIVTVHPTLLLLAMAGAGAATVGLALLLAANERRHRLLLCATFFLGASLVGHVLLSRLANLTPVSVELVRIGGNDLRPAGE
jgi:hypothetical protein